MDRALHMSDFFTYSSKNLVDQPVIAMNGDISKLTLVLEASCLLEMFILKYHKNNL